MKLRLDFGTHLKREVTWSEDINSFPTLVMFEEKAWQWIFYDRDFNKQVDFILMFAPSTLKTDEYTPIIENMFRYQFEYGYKCECGAIYDKDFPNIHSFWCPKWRKDQ